MSTPHVWGQERRRESESRKLKEMTKKRLLVGSRFLHDKSSGDDNEMVRELTAKEKGRWRKKRL